MDWGGFIPVLITALIAAIPGTLIALIALKKTPGESQKTQADSNAVDVETFEKLVSKVEKQSDELVTVRRQVWALESKNQALWHYVYELLEFVIGKDMEPPLPPIALESDPKLFRLINNRK